MAKTFVNLDKELHDFFLGGSYSVICKYHEIAQISIKNAKKIYLNLSHFDLRGCF